MAVPLLRHFWNIDTSGRYTARDAKKLFKVALLTKGAPSQQERDPRANRIKAERAGHMIWLAWIPWGRRGRLSPRINVT